jgi:hypothetical protein
MYWVLYRVEGNCYVIYSSFKKIWDKSEHSIILPGKLEPAHTCACLDMNTPYTTEWFSCLRIVAVVGSRGEQSAQSFSGEQSAQSFSKWEI